MYTRQFLLHIILILVTLPSLLLAQRSAGDNPQIITWHTLGTASEGVNNRVNAITSYQGKIIVAGQFTTAGGISANRIAAWDGNSWTPLGLGFDNTVRALAVMGNTLYAGGDFTAADGNPANRIAKWSGAGWSPLANGVNNTVNALTVHGDSLFVGGTFTDADGLPAPHMAKWDGIQWSLVKGFGDFVLCLTTFNNAVYAGGRFTHSSGVPMQYIARWSGSVWEPVGSGMNNFVYTLASENDTLYAGGTFTQAGGVSAPYIAKWSGGQWSGLGGGTNDFVFAVSAVGGDVFAAGQFATAGTVAANRIAKFRSGVWESINSGINNTIYSLYADGSTGSMFVGGTFTQAGGMAASRITRFTDSENPLPVELISFTAKNHQSGILLEWNTASELHNKEFRLQRKTGAEWQTLAVIPGSGTTTEEKSYIYLDKNVTAGMLYIYRLAQSDYNGTVSYSGEIFINTVQPHDFALLAGYPNPFNPSANIQYRISEGGFTELSVYTNTGEFIRNLVSEEQFPGSYTAEFYAGNLPSGVYFIRLKSGRQSAVIPLLLQK